VGESAIHIGLVDRLKRYILTMVPEESAALLQVDTPETSTTTPVGGFFPDLFYRYGTMLIIGEAKTFGDVTRKHSQEQFRAYLKACERFEGNAFLVVGVDWRVSATAKNFFRRNRTWWTWWNNYSPCCKCKHLCYSHCRPTSSN